MNTTDIPFSHYCIALGFLGCRAALPDDADDDIPVAPLLSGPAEMNHLRDDLHEAGLLKDNHPAFKNVDEALERLRQWLATTAKAPVPDDERSRLIQQMLNEQKYPAKVVAAVVGPQATRFELEVDDNASLTKFKQIVSSLEMGLKTQKALRILLPIPGKARVGIEVPNAGRVTVPAQELFNSAAWRGTQARIPLVLGKNLDGDVRIIDLAQAPHLLVAGSTGSGKTVGVNLMIQSLIRRFRPDELKLLLFDPKYLEFQPYSDLPHLLAPVINEPKKVVLALSWAIDEMNRRYQLLGAARCRNIADYNAAHTDANLPYIVIVLDEIADLMWRDEKEYSNALAILAAKSRAAGIHLIIATQRPDAKVITGVIKANFPWRIAFQVIDAVNSRVILDQKDAECLLGQGDMLFKGDGTPERIQGGYITSEEIDCEVKRCIAAHSQPDFAPFLKRALDATDTDNAFTTAKTAHDPLVPRVLDVIRLERRASTASIQRRLGLGYNRATALLDELEDLGYLGPQPVSGLREVNWNKFPDEK